MIFLCQEILTNRSSKFLHSKPWLVNLERFLISYWSNYWLLISNWFKFLEWRIWLVVTLFLSSLAFLLLSTKKIQLQVIMKLKLKYELCYIIYHMYIITYSKRYVLWFSIQLSERGCCLSYQSSFICIIWSFFSRALSSHRFIYCISYIIYMCMM